MIKLYREEISPLADTIEAEFKDMVLGYERELINPAAAQALFAGHRLPIITNNEKIISGDGLLPYVKELERLMRDWQLFQGDYCYVDDDGNGC